MAPDPGRTGSARTAARWRPALDGRPGVSNRVYEADDRLFFAGSGPSSPLGSMEPHDVVPAAGGDVAAWLEQAPGGPRG